MRAGFIGLGRMGQAMAVRLVTHGHEVMAYNRTASRLDALIQSGGKVAGSIAGAAQFGGLVLTMVADDAALLEIARGPGGLLEALPKGGIHVAMGTHGVRTVRELEQQHVARGQALVSAPVLGRPDAVTAGRLAVIVAGEPGAVSRCAPLLESLGRKVFHAGTEAASAAAMKLANNVLLACAIAAMGEAFALVQKSGADPSTFCEVLCDGLFASPAYSGYSRLIVDRAWDKPGFTVALGLKDVQLGLAAGEAVAVPMPSANVCRDRLLGAIAHGDAQRDWAAMALEQARASGLA